MSQIKSELISEYTKACEIMQRYFEQDRKPDLYVVEKYNDIAKKMGRPLYDKRRGIYLE